MLIWKGRGGPYGVRLGMYDCIITNVHLHIEALLLVYLRWIDRAVIVLVRRVANMAQCVNT